MSSAGTGTVCRVVAILAAAGTVLLSGCGYRAGSLMHPQIASMAVGSFENATPEPGLTGIDYEASRLERIVERIVGHAGRNPVATHDRRVIFLGKQGCDTQAAEMFAYRVPDIPIALPACVYGE